MEIKHFFDSDTYTLTYLVWDKNTLDAIIIDPVLDFDQASSSVSTQSVEQYAKEIKSLKLNLKYILETHIHADHLTGSSELKKHFPNVKIGINSNVLKVANTFKKIFNFGDSFITDGSQFDLLLGDGDLVEVGSFQVKIMHTPGHTPACTTFIIGDAIFTGDALFMPDYGTGRCDFPDGSATDLYRSIQKIYQLDDDFTVYTAHDYQPGGRALRYSAKLAEQKKSNIHIRKDTTEKEFVEFRTKRDAQLNAPKLLFPSLQINLLAGCLPPQESNGSSYLKTPIRKK